MEAANNLDRVLAERKIHLVYGRGTLGLIRCVTTTAHIGESKVLGIIPTILTVRNIIGKIIREELQVSNM